MPALLILIIASLGIASVFLLGFIWAAKSGQFEDTCTPSMRILTDDVEMTKSEGRSSKETPNPKPEPGEQKTEQVEQNPRRHSAEETATFITLKRISSPVTANKKT